jgi:hypothetical protein
MKIHTALAIVGALALIGTVPAIAGQSPLTGVQLIASGDSTDDHDTYAHQARDKIQDWRQKLHDVGEKAKAEGKELGADAQKELNAAWKEAEAASHRLETASAQDWNDAKASFEKSSHELSDAWHRNYPKDK